MLLYYWCCFALSAPTKVPMSGGFKMVFGGDGWGRRGVVRESPCWTWQLIELGFGRSRMLRD